MRNIELEALRRLLFFSVPEAAECIGDCRERSWRKWESGDRGVPDDVADRIRLMIKWRGQAIQAMVESIADGERASGVIPENIVLVWYDSVDDWITLDGRESALFRPQCSVIAEVAAAYKCNIVVFNPAGYFDWLDGHGWKDSEQMRGQWAAGQI